MTSPGVWADELRQDTRYAVRRLSRAPWSSLAAVAILAAGLTSSVAIFTIPIGRWVANVLYGVEPWDPVSLGMAALILLVAAGVAAVPPVLRAVRLDPAESLRP